MALASTFLEIASGYCEPMEDVNTVTATMVGHEMLVGRIPAAPPCSAHVSPFWVLLSGHI